MEKTVNLKIKQMSKETALDDYDDFDYIINNNGSIEELIEKVKDAQTDKDGKTILLYAANKDAQHSYIEAAKAKTAGINQSVTGATGLISMAAPMFKKGGKFGQMSEADASALLKYLQGGSGLGGE